MEQYGISDNRKKHKAAETEKAKEENPIKFRKTHDFAASENICSCTEQILNWFDEIWLHLCLRKPANFQIKPGDRYQKIEKVKR